MYCKYSREALEMYCSLSRYFEIDLCWNIKEHMKKCEFFTEVSKDEWLEIQNKSDDEFLRDENIPDIVLKKKLRNNANKKMKHVSKREKTTILGYE